MPDKKGQVFMSGLIKSPFGILFRGRFMVITVTGWKSGKPISTPINLIKDGDGYFTISSRERTWWRNLRGAAPVTLQYGSVTLRMMGEVFETSAEVAAKLKRIFEIDPKTQKILGVRSNDEKVPVAEDVQRLAAKRVVVWFSKPTPSS